MSEFVVNPLPPKTELESIKILKYRKPRFCIHETFIMYRKLPFVYMRRSSISTYAQNISKIVHRSLLLPKKQQNLCIVHFFYIDNPHFGIH
jgi:hypothetical protein